MNRRFILVLSLIALVCSMPWLVDRSAAQPTIHNQSHVAGSSVIKQGGSPIDPPPTGYRVKYFFTGLIDHEHAATAIHCINLGNLAEDIIIQLYNDDASDTYELEKLLQAGWTYTFITSESDFFNDSDSFETGFIEQGSGRILIETNGDNGIVCSAQVVQKAAPIPTFAYDLPLYTY